MPKTIKMQTLRSSQIAVKVISLWITLINFKAGHSPNSVAALQQAVRSQWLDAFHFTFFPNISSWMKMRISELCCFLKENQKSIVNLLKMYTSTQNRANPFRLYKSMCLNVLDHVYAIWSYRILILIGTKVLWPDAFNIIKFIGNHLISTWIVRKLTILLENIAEEVLCVKHHEVPYSSEVFA